MKLSVLLITASPDMRRSTRDLEVAADALGRRSDVRVGLWYLRHGDRGPAQHSWTVDDLRTWRPVATLDRLGARLPANLLRGRRLRRCLRALNPDVVVLDDGLGARVLDRSANPLLLTRRNAVGPVVDSSEPHEAQQVAVLDSDPWSRRPEGVPVLELGTMREEAGSNGIEERLVGRRALGLPEDVDVVVALASEVRPELLVEVLRGCATDRGPEVHGLWLDPHGSPVDCRAARECASTGGVSGLFHLRQVGLSDALPVADVVLLDRGSADARVRNGLDPMLVVQYGADAPGGCTSTPGLHERVLERLGSTGGGFPSRTRHGGDPDEWAELFVVFVGELTEKGRP